MEAGRGIGLRQHRPAGQRSEEGSVRATGALPSLLHHKLKKADSPSQKDPPQLKTPIYSAAISSRIRTYAGDWTASPKKWHLSQSISSFLGLTSGMERVKTAEGSPSEL